MKIYRVGGAVRDELLGLPIKDHDYVVVGSDPEEMMQLGFRPVGKDFPVFLHPQTNEEYALARTERKTGADTRDSRYTRRATLHWSRISLAAISPSTRSPRTSRAI